MRARIAVAIATLCVVLCVCDTCGASSSKSGALVATAPVDTILYQNLGCVEGSNIVISKVVDLGGRQCNLPQGYTLVFEDGIIKNGILNGNQTKIAHRKKAIFNHVDIKGTWQVFEISSKFFKDLSYDNAVRNVIALSNPKLNNRIVIEEGDYPVSVQRASETCLSLGSNTELLLNGSVRLKPNDFKSYYIIRVEGENVIVRGEGSIIGDKNKHTGSIGEWGMGIVFDGARNAIASGLTIKDCWGDCIYVGGDSKNVTIEECVIDNGRRQGISITKADGVTIRNCKILNVEGTKPEYAIDLEPNRNCIINNVTIENVEIENCEGGIVTTKGKKDVESKRIGTVVVRNCTVSALSKYPMSMKACEKLTIEGCTVTGNERYSPIFTRDTRHVIIKDNTIYMKPKTAMKGEKTITKRFPTDNSVMPIEVVAALRQEITGNSIIAE